MTGIYSRNMSPQALAKKILSSLQITIKLLLLRKLLVNNVKILSGKSFVKGD